MKILHCADIHLDSPFSSCSPQKSEERRGTLRAVFEAMMKYAKKENIPLVLISGDLFDYGFVTKKTADLLLRVFSDMPETKIVIAPGNHDAHARGGIYDTVKFPENVFIFEGEDLSSFDFPELGTCVYGYAFTSEKLETSPLAGKRAENKDRINLLCIHADITSPISRYAPVSREDIASFGAHYAALGHIHNPGDIESAGGCTYAYSGCPEGRSFDETGYKGAVIVDIDPETKKVSAARKIFSKGRYEIENVDVTGAESDLEVVSKIEKKTAELGYGADTSLRVTLVGEVSPSYIPVPSAIEEGAKGLYLIEVKDATLPIYGCESLDGDMTLRGELWRTLKEKMSTGTRDERETAVLAFRYALAALDGRPITD